ncbi:MAG: hypothetical protein K0Q90_3465 [Paenibacillaceae bacterium]|nr:hypothetical protein [Paenibacillaceae bacterium]
MGLWIDDMERLRRELAEDQGHRKRLWEAMEERVMSGIMQRVSLTFPEDTMEWWHLVWERLGDAAFVQAVSPRPELARWVREVLLDLCRRPADDWIGPWFRKRSTPAMGMLETAHIVAAVFTAYDLCGDLFTDGEREEIRQAVKAKGMEPCRLAASKYIQEKKKISNWFVVLANGYGTAAVMLGDEAAVEEAIGFYHEGTKLFNGDSYGESLQYSNYTSIHLVHLREVLLRFDSSLADRLDPGCFVRMIPWYAASLMYMKPLEGWGEQAYPRSINFGDSTAIFRPSGDMLLHAAARCAADYPREAGLARWLFDTAYADPRLGPTDAATFGFINSYQFLSVLLLSEAVPAIPPWEADLPLLSPFETGGAIVRDKWKEPDTILAVQGGFQPHHVAAHRHADQNSFILAYRKERFFADSGHCCYRLSSFRTARETAAHTTWSFVTGQEDGGGKKVIGQKEVYGNIYTPHQAFSYNRIVQQMGHIHVIRADCAELYGDPVIKAERTWIAVMPHILFVVDRLEARTPVQVQSHFVLNNRDNRLKVNEAAENKLVLRRGDAAMKFFLLNADSEAENNPCRLTRHWGYMHDCYHPQPNQKGQGKEGSALIFRYETEVPHVNHTMVYAIAMDQEPQIKGWHLKVPEKGRYFAEPTSHKGGVTLQLPRDGGDWLIHDHANGDVYRVGSDRVERLTNA